jgi:G3E family GTPase
MSTIPVHIVAGFLGSGKTTLMNRLLGGLPEATRPAVIVNDFGEVPLDGTLIERQDYALKELPSGCVCCSLRGPLSTALRQMAEEIKPDVVLMETTGVARPIELVRLLAGGELAGVVHAGNVVCMVDCCAFCRYETHFHVLTEQVHEANTVFINRVDSADAETRASTRARIDFLKQPDAVVQECEFAEVPLALILEERPVYLDAEGLGHHHHGHDFVSVSVEDDGCYDAAALAAFLEGLLGKVARAKGILQTSDGWKLYQLTLSGLDVSDWPHPVAQSRLVIIGAEFDRRSLLAELATLQAS